MIELLALPQLVGRQPAPAGWITDRRCDAHVIDDVETLRVESSGFVEDAGDAAAFCLDVKHMHGPISAHSVKERDPEPLHP